MFGQSTNVYIQVRIIGVARRVRVVRVAGVVDVAGVVEVVRDSRGKYV